MTAATVATTSTLFASVEACYLAAATFDAKVVALRAALKVHRVPFEMKAVKSALMPETAKYYHVTLKTKERGEGTTWNLDVDAAKAKAARAELPKDTPDAQVPYTKAHAAQTNTAKVQNDRLAKAVLGESSGAKGDKYEATEEMIALAKKLAKLALAYRKEARDSMLASALAVAKKETEGYRAE